MLLHDRGAGVPGRGPGTVVYPGCTGVVQGRVPWWVPWYPPPPVPLLDHGRDPLPSTRCKQRVSSSGIPSLQPAPAQCGTGIITESLPVTPRCGAPPGRFLTGPTAASRRPYSGFEEGRILRSRPRRLAALFGQLSSSSFVLSDPRIPSSGSLVVTNPDSPLFAGCLSLLLLSHDPRNPPRGYGLLSNILFRKSAMVFLPVVTALKRCSSSWGIPPLVARPSIGGSRRRSLPVSGLSRPLPPGRSHASRRRWSVACGVLYLKVRRTQRVTGPLGPVTAGFKAGLYGIPVNNIIKRSPHQ